MTNDFLPDGLWLMDALGFRYVTNRAWAKMTPEEHALRGTCWWMQRPGLGQYFFGQHELLLFGVRGKLPARHKGTTTQDFRACELEGLKKPRTLLLAPRGEHSEKPQAAYDDITHVTPGPRLEMFARGARAGWDVWGNEAPTSSEAVGHKGDVSFPGPAIATARLAGVPCPECAGAKFRPGTLCERCGGTGEIL